MKTKLKLSNNFPNILYFYKDINKAFAKHPNTTKPTCEDKSDSSDIIPAYAHDFGNYVARYGMGNFQIQFIMKFEDRLDFDKLSRAVRLSVDAEPVLGCRFVEHNPPYWKRLEDIDKTIFCSMEETDNAEESLNRFLESPLDMDQDPMVKVKLIRSGENDTLVIKLNHTCADGAGVRDYVHLLSNIYTCIDSENGEYVPKPSVRSKEDHDKMFNTLGIKHPELDNSVVDAPRTVWPFSWKSGGRADITPIVICQLPQGQLDVLSKYAKERGATINDLILTAFYRAMFKIIKPAYGIPMDMGLTVDLRRYLPDNKAEAIRNLSGGVILRVTRVMGETFEGTLSRVVSVMKRKKSGNPGYQCAICAEHAEKMNFHQLLTFTKFISKVSEISSQNCFFCSPGLSNIGIVSKSLIKFSENIVTEAYFIPPVVRAPAFLLVASSYNGIMTLSAGYYEGSLKRGYMEKLLNRIKSELIEGCK